MNGLPPGLLGYETGRQANQQATTNQISQLGGLLGIQNQMENAPLQHQLLQTQVTNAQHPVPIAKDLGGSIGLFDARTMQQIGEIPKSVTQDTLAKERGANERHIAPSGDALAREQGSMYRFQNPSASAKLSANTATTQGSLNRQNRLTIAGLGPDGAPTGDVKDIANAIATGSIPPLTSFAMAKPRGQQIMSEVMKINPNYDFKEIQAQKMAQTAFAKGPEAQKIRSFNVALTHLDTLDKLSTALDNGDLPAVNKLGQLYSTQTGSSAPTNFDSAKKIVGDEIVKAIVGSGGGVTDREEAAKTISNANSPAQLKGAINTYKELMRGQLGGLRQQYEASTGKKDFDRFLSDEAKANVKAAAPQRRASDNALPPTNAKGWGLHVDANGNKAYVSPDGKQFEDAK